MTSHELAKKLLKMDDVMVTVRGYEGGVNTVERVYAPAPIHLNANMDEEWYYGKHEYHEDRHCSTCDKLGYIGVRPTIKAIHIG
jgi:hypothetical protein